MKHVAITGPIHSGKTTVANMLVKDLDYTRLSFADALRDELATAIAGNDLQHKRALLAEMRDPIRKAFWRQTLQWWGTELRRQRYGADYWVDKTREHIKANPDKLFVVDDCRFPNEYEMLKELDFLFVRLEANPNFPPTEAEIAHESEQYWGDFEYYVFLPYSDDLKLRGKQAACYIELFSDPEFEKQFKESQAYFVDGGEPGHTLDEINDEIALKQELKLMTSFGFAVTP